MLCVKGGRLVCRAVPAEKDQRRLDAGGALQYELLRGRLAVRLLR
jgi:hypothetical protein